MDPSRQIGAFTRGFPSAYPNADTALAWVLCVPGTGYGWHEYQGKSEIYGEAYTRKKVKPVAWEMYADGDNTIRRYIECFTAKTPLAEVPANATREWVDQCRHLVDVARRVGVSTKIQAKLDLIDTSLQRTWPSPTPQEIQAAKDMAESKWAQIMAKRRAAAPDENEESEDISLRHVQIEMIRYTLASTYKEATFRTPKIEAAIQALESVGALWLFEDVGRSTGSAYRVVAIHPDTAKDDLLDRIHRTTFDVNLPVAAEILTPEEFAQWKAKAEWEARSSRFLMAGGESAYGDDPETLFYRAMVCLQTAPWTWPLIETAIEIFGEPAEGLRTVFTPLWAPHTFNDTTTGIIEPRRVYPYTNDGWVSGDLPAYKPARYYRWEQLVEGIVVAINGVHYRVSYPLVQVYLDARTNNTCLQYDEYPNPTAPVIIERTSDRLTPCSRKETPEYGVQFFGKPCWQQQARFPVWKNKVGSILFTLFDGWGDCGTTNIMFCTDENGVPVRVFHEASCT